MQFKQLYIPKKKNNATKLVYNSIRKTFTKKIVLVCYLWHLQYTITIKMADQERSDYHVVFGMILFGLNFCLESSNFDSKVIYVSDNESAKTIMVKTTNSQTAPRLPFFA